MDKDASLGSVEIAVPQRYKDFIVGRQYRLFKLVCLGSLGLDGIYYLLCVAFHWTWSSIILGDMVVSAVVAADSWRKANQFWQYEINEWTIKLFVFAPKNHLTGLKEIAWAQVEIVSVERSEWQGLPAISLTVRPAHGYTYLLVYNLTDEEEVKTKVLPLIEKYRRKYRQELWADKLRS